MFRNPLKTVLIAAVLINIGFVQPSDAEFTCNIDGESFVADIAYWEDAFYLASPIGRIYAFDKSKESYFNIRVDGHFEVKTYSLSPSNFTYVSYVDGSLGMPYTAVSGTLTITSKTDNRLQGEFEMTLGGSKATGEVVMLEVTDGSFDLPSEITISTTTTSTDITTTSIPSQPCPSEAIYGKYSEEVELLRYIRDNVLRQTAEGRELIRLYYEWSPAVVKAMEADEEFREEVKNMIEGVLMLIAEESK